jgi:hypothetical protein
MLRVANVHCHAGRVRLCFTLVWLVVIHGCGKAEVSSPLVAIKGIVQVDGKPQEGIVLTLHPTDQTDAISTGAISTGVSADGGAFQISTYKLGDGASPGKYKVTCVWSEFDPVMRSQTGDRLEGRYAQVERTPICWDIVEGKPLDAGTIDLVSK